jgi:hypothetical protein
MAIEITAADVTNAEEFLAAVVADRVPDGRFTDGTALRDLCIKALAVVSAQHRKDNARTQSLQSLLRVRELARTENDPAVDDAADAILSNMFFTRTPGMYARGQVTIFVSRKQDYVIPRTSQVFYDRSLVFYPDTTTDVVIPSTSVTPITDSSGRVAAYSFTLRLIAAKTGAQYNVFPAVWAGNGGFSPYVTRITSSTRFDGGTARQSTVNYIDQARNAMAVRNLINERSVLATLPQRFPAATNILVVGMGDPEMQRDQVVELAANINLHVGGHFDIYADMPVAQASFEGIVGGVYTRPDGVINVFDDTGVADWTVTDVQVGDVIRVTAGLSEVPRDFPIREIRASEMYVSKRYGFPETATGLTYYIYRPLFGPDVQILPAFGTNTTGFTAATVQTANRIVLPPEPHYDIVDVMVTNPDPADPGINDPDGYVHFFQRVDTAPSLTGLDNTQYPFRVVGRSPVDGQSARAFDEIELPPGYNGKRLRVNYLTQAGFSTVDAYVRDRYVRVLCANVQYKARHPIYLSMRIPYSLSPLAQSTVDELRLRQAIVAYINTFDPRDILDVSDISTYVKNFASNIGTVYAFEIEYSLLAPNGNTYDFSTEDIVAMRPEFALPESPISLTEMLAMGVSDRTVRYQTRLERVAVDRI